MDNRKRNIYKKFVDSIRCGNFVLPYCKVCQKNIWPPTDVCRYCLGNIFLQDSNSKIGKILEVFFLNIDDKTNNNLFLIVVELNKVILLGSLHLAIEKRINIGDWVRIKKCGFKESRIFYEFQIVDKFD